MSRYERGYDRDRDGPTRLYVGRVSSRVRTRDLEDVFSKYGRLRDVDLKTDFAFVEYYDTRDADDAVHYLNGKELGGSRIVVEFARRIGEGPRGGPREYLGRGPPPGTGRCYNCGKDGHWARDCKAGDWSNKCYKCGDRGHIERNCTRGGRGRYDSRSPSPYHGRGRGRSRSRSYSRSRSRGRSYSRSPVRNGRSRSPVRNGRSRTPVRRGRSPSRSRSRTPVRCARKSYSRSPSPAKSGSPPPKKGSRSPPPKRGSRSPSPVKDRSASPKKRSPSPANDRERSPVD